MKRKAVILSIVVVLSMMVTGIGASTTTAPGPAQQAPVPAQQTTPQTNDSDTTGAQVGTQSAPTQAGEPPYPIDIPPSQLRNGSIDTSTLPENMQSNGEYAVNRPSAGFVSKSTANVSKTTGDASVRPAPDYEVEGPTLLWPSLDATAQSGPNNDARYYFKNYTLKVVSPSVEIWVANDLSYQEGDPRPTPEISQAQLLYLADEFTNNIEPKESQLYRDPVPQRGTDSPLYPPPPVENGSLPDDYYQSADNKSRTVLLVDNVRDQNYYNPDYPTYIAGFFSPRIGQLTDRNVMVIDSNDWDDRLGGPDAPWKQDEGDAESEDDFGIESTTAHEYQHLLHSYADPDETTWINEGLSEVTPYRVGYGIPGSIEFYERYPSNSLIEWEDQLDEAPITILADYGAAGLFQLYGSQQFGIEFTQAVFNDDANGIQSVKNSLGDVGAERDFYSFYQDFSTALLTDGRNTQSDRYQIDGLDFDANTSEVIYTKNNLTAAYGNAYEPLDLGGNTLNDFNVSGIQAPPTRWTTAPDPTGESNDPVLYSQKGNGLNNWAIFNADLSGTQNPVLKFDTYYQIERGFDYGFVQISTDGGETWTSLENENTTSYRASPDYLNPVAKRNLPGFTGISGGNLGEGGTTYADASWVTEEFDLSEYAGEDVLIAFRYVTDGAAVRPGFYVRDVRVPAAGISYSGASTEPFQSLREATNNYIEYMYSFVGIRDDGSTEVVQLPRKTFENGSPMSLSQFPTDEFEQTIFTVTWAPEMRDTGTVPYGYEANPEAQQPPEDGDKNTLTIIGVDGSTNYGFSVTGNVGEADGTVEQQFRDEIGEYTGSGVVGPSRDSYTFTGKLIRLEVSDQAKVLLNGERIDPDDYPDNILRVSGDDGATRYGFSASRPGVSEAADSVEQQFADRIGAKTGSGVAGSSQDIYSFNGQLVRLEVSDQATVILNGEEINPADYPDDILRISGVDGNINYEFAANSGVNEAYNVEQQFADRIAGNSGSGIAGPSEDAYAFTGDLVRLEVSGPATVIHNGVRIDPDDYPDNIITISGVGETVSYEFSATGDVDENFGVEQQFADNIEDTTGSGVVGPGEDSYTFAGELRSLSVNGNAVVTVNGEEVDESEV